MFVLRILSTNYLPSVLILYRIVGRPYTSKHRVLTDFCEDKVVLRCCGILFLEVCTRSVKYTGQKEEREREKKKEEKKKGGGVRGGEREGGERETKRSEGHQRSEGKSEGHQKKQTDKQSLR